MNGIRIAINSDPHPVHKRKPGVYLCGIPAWTQTFPTTLRGTRFFFAHILSGGHTNYLRFNENSVRSQVTAPTYFESVGDACEKMNDCKIETGEGTGNALERWYFGTD